MKYTIVTIFILVGSLLFVFFLSEMITNKDQYSYESGFAASYVNDSFGSLTSGNTYIKSNHINNPSLGVNNQNAFYHKEALFNNENLLKRTVVSSSSSTTFRRESNNKNVSQSVDKSSVLTSKTFAVGAQLNDVHLEAERGFMPASDAGMQRVDFPPPGDGDDGGLGTVPVGGGFWMLLTLALLMIGFKLKFGKKFA